MKENNTEINIENIKTDDDFVMEINEDTFVETETQNITYNTDTNLHKSNLFKLKTCRLLPEALNTYFNISQNEIKLQGSTEEQNTKEKNQGKLILI